MKAIRRFTVRAVLPESLRELGDVAANLRWSWHAPTQDLFARIDPDLWESVGRDATRFLGEVPAGRWAELEADPDFGSHLAWVAEGLRTYLQGDRWYQSVGPEAPRSIAYFSPEYGITEALPQYSGGLGILAGDHLKAASDLGVPIIAAGLFYGAGYFRQSMTADGWQLETYAVQDPAALPLALLRNPDGSPVVITVDLPDGPVHAYVWCAQVGRVPLLLLDSDVEGNTGSARDVTDRLYGGGGEHRLAQELLLGVGGVRAIEAYCGITGTPVPEVFHTNEGHAGFLGIERIRQLQAAGSGLTFDEALWTVRSGTVFTTHTPVPAGIDRFPKDVVERHLRASGYLDAEDTAAVLGIGSESYPGGDPSMFNMAVMGLRLAQRRNGVSKLHGQVSREMFAGVWPGLESDDVPIASVTNGVHGQTWIARELRDLIAARAGEDAVGEAAGCDALAAADDDVLWAAKRRLRDQLVHDVRARVRDSWRTRGAAEAELAWTDEILDPDVLTIGFARRVPSYKRLTLMLRDPDRLRALLLHPTHPIQLVIAGKAHPADDGGKSLIRKLITFADDPAVRHRIAFLPDYDIAMAQKLYAGCDVWLNNPLRPLEACGTSGMKAALNGALNLSILDGWWAEWYDGQNGWAIPTAEGVGDPERRDDLEANALYDLLERSVTAAFYERDSAGRPVRWLARLRHTFTTLGPKVLASRMVRDYVQTLYLPAAAASRRVVADGARGGRELAAYVRRAHDHWPEVVVERVESVGVSDNPQRGDVFTVRASVALGALAPDDVCVEVVMGRVDESDRLVDQQHVALEPRHSNGFVTYEGDITLERTGPLGFTVRVLPQHPGLAAPTELGLVTVPIGITVDAPDDLSMAAYSGG